MLFEETMLYRPGDLGYHECRTPVLLATQDGTILAFNEARKFTGRDSDQVDLFLRRSTDCGRTFGDVQVVASEDGWVSGNPAPVQDHDTGAIQLLFCKHPSDDPGRTPVNSTGEIEVVKGNLPRTVWITRSTDDGATWSEPTEITDQVKEPSWTWYATGPCHGIQLENGRLLVPCDHTEGNEHNHEISGRSHVVYSDDHGESWQIGGIAQAGTNESVIVQTGDGRLYLNCRNYVRDTSTGERMNRRAYAWSRDNGKNFTDFGVDEALVGSVCQAGMIRLSDGSVTRPDREDRNWVLFTNPTGMIDGRYDRLELTVRLSYDGCLTWPVSRVICDGPSAYSDLCIASDGTICCLYERGSEGGVSEYSGSIVLARFDLEWLLRGRGIV